jgi:ABC-type glycerol-3-phosphate transport system substrate-binding protein
MARGVLLPIDDLTADSTIINADGYVQGVWDNGFWEGTQYCCPGNEGFIRMALFYNARLAEEAGLDPDTPPETWGELMEWHQALNKFDDGGNLIQTGINPYDAMGGSLQFDNGWFAPHSWGFDWFDEDAGTFNLDNEGLAESMEVMGEFIRVVGPDNMAGMFEVEGQGTCGGAYYTEVQAMTIQGYWTAGGTANNAPEVSEYTRSTWAPVPESRRGTKLQTTGGHYILFFKDAPNPEKAFKIAELVNTDPACDAIFEQLGWLPAKLSYLETADRDRYNGLSFFFDALEEANSWHAPERCQITAFVQTQYQELREKVFRDEMTGAEAAAEMQERCDQEWQAAGLG